MTRSLATFALAAGLALPAQAFDMTAMTDEERSAFRLEIREYLIENPEVLLEAIQVLEDREAQAQAAGDLALVADNAEALFNDDHSWVGGNPDGDLVVVEFLDYRCGYCRKAHPEVSELVASDGNIKLSVKEFPILGEQSTISSRFAIATHLTAGDDAYKAVHESLITLRSNATAETLGKLADTLGLDSAAILAAMDSPEVTEIINTNRALARDLNISGTPTFVVGGQMLRGYVPLEGMRAVVADERG